MTQATVALETRDITQKFKDTLALDKLSMTIPSGKVVGLLGRNGAGKSTLLRIASGQLKPTGGEVSIFGQAVYDNAKALSQLCLIGDTPDFGGLARLNDLFAVCGGLFPDWDNEAAKRLATDTFDLPMKKRLKGYSRGMQTAVGLIVGLCSGAKLTIFDEPSLGLDAVMRERFYDLLIEYGASSERTFVLSTHLIDEVARVLDAAVLIDAGRLLASGAIGDMTEKTLSVSGAPDAVRELTDGLHVYKEESLAGALVRHVKLDSDERRERIASDSRVTSAPIGLQRLFVFLTEEKEAQRHAANH